MTGVTYAPVKYHFVFKVFYCLFSNVNKLVHIRNKYRELFLREHINQRRNVFVENLSIIQLIVKIDHSYDNASLSLCLTLFQGNNVLLKLVLLVKLRWMSSVSSYSDSIYVTAIIQDLW